ncbi:MAG: 50S ribosomal protein L11 methyltransferase [Nevskiales bacterium]
MTQTEKPETPEPLHWLQISLPGQPAEVVEEALWAAGAVAVTLRDAADQPLLEPMPGATPLWDAVIVTGLFDNKQATAPLLAQLRQMLPEQLVDQATTELLEDRAWVRAWMAHFQPLRCGQRLWVCPSHQSVEQKDAVVIKLDPGLAFGTGSHPTTALCLRWLDQAKLQGKTVIDYGCGSGILAVAAALLGAKEVWAVDIDPQAIEATRSNAQRNGVGNIIRYGQPETLPNSSTADIVIANILAGPLIELAPHILAQLRKPGELVLAGLLCEQVADVSAAYAQDIALQTFFTEQDWALLAGKQ